MPSCSVSEKRKGSLSARVSRLTADEKTGPSVPTFYRELSLMFCADSLDGYGTKKANELQPLIHGKWKNRTKSKQCVLKASKGVKSCR